MNYLRIFFIIMLMLISFSNINSQIINETSSNKNEIEAFINIYHQHHDFFCEAFSFQGLEGGLIINKKLYLGIYAAFFVSNLKIMLNNETRFLWMGQWGINASYIFWNEKRIHPGVQLNLGIFNLRYDVNNFSIFETNKAAYKLKGLVISPQLFGEYNLADWFQIRIGLSYNIYNYNDHSSIKTSGLNNVSFTFGMLFSFF